MNENEQKQTQIDTNGHQNEQKRTQQETLCWTCRHSTCSADPKFLPLSKTLPSGRVSKQTICPWASNYTPIPNWTAVQTNILNQKQSQITTSYNITKCPYYSPDTEGIVAQMTEDELKKLLYLPVTYIRRHSNLTKQIAIKYIKELNKREPSGATTNAITNPTTNSAHSAAINKEKGPLPTTNTERIALIKAIIKRHRYFVKCDLEVLDASERREINALTAELNGCEAALTILKRISAAPPPPKK